MKTIKLLPNNKRLKQLIKEFGEEWDVLEEQYVQCFFAKGYYIRSKNGCHERWVRPEDSV